MRKSLVYGMSGGVGRGMMLPLLLVFLLFLLIFFSFFLQNKFSQKMSLLLLREYFSVKFPYLFLLIS